MAMNAFNGSAAPDWKAAEKAVEMNDIDTLRAYLDGGGDVNRQDGSGNMTLLMWAGFSNREEIARLLLDRGAEVNIVDTNCRETALHWAVEKGAEKITGMILEKNPDIDHPDSNGETALIYAARQGYPGIACLLLDKGAAHDLADHEGKTALDHATEANPSVGADVQLRKDEIAGIIRDVAAKREAEAKAARDALEAALKFTAETVEACRNGTRNAVTLSRKLQFKPPISAG